MGRDELASTASTVKLPLRVRRVLVAGIVVGALAAGACTGEGGDRELPTGFLSVPWAVVQSQRAGRTLRLYVLEDCLTKGERFIGFARFDHLQVDEGEQEIFIAALSKRVMLEPEGSEEVGCSVQSASPKEVTYQLKAPLGSRKFIHAPISPEWPKDLTLGRDAPPDGPPPPRLKTPPPA